ncbi:MAG: hypothetical protein GY926_07070 [bacterium]|nr:hypothetical protein [Gammaproteobacteria bacterium]MCP4964979.1 hypothetical protein [bacterium]
MKFPLKSPPSNTDTFAPPPPKNGLTRVIRGKSRCGVLSALLLGASLGIAANAQAGCSLGSAIDCAGDAWEAIEGEVISPVGDTFAAGYTEVYVFSEEQFSTANDLVETAQTEANNTIYKVGEGAKAIADLATSGYKTYAENFVNGVKPQLELYYNLMRFVYSNSRTVLDELAEAIKGGNGTDTVDSIEDLLPLLFNQGTFAAVLDDFKDQGASSMLFTVGVGGGSHGVGAGGAVGVAIDVRFLSYAYKFYQTHSNLTNLTQQYVDEPIASLFVAAGLSAGVEQGVNVDYAVGYHVSGTDGVGGPGLDVGVGVTGSVIGGAVGVGFDISKLPWEIVTTNMAMSAGTPGVSATAGPSYTHIIGLLCGDGRIRPQGFARVRGCSTSTYTGYTEPVVGLGFRGEDSWMVAHDRAYQDIRHAGATGFLAGLVGVSNSTDVPAFREYNDIIGLWSTDSSVNSTSYSLSLDGSQAYFERSSIMRAQSNPGTINFGKNDDFTVALWIKADVNQPALSPSVVEKWNSAGGYPFVIRYNRTDGVVGGARYVWEGPNPSVTSTSNIAGSWHHVAFVKQGGWLKLYIDGVLEAFSEDTTTGDTTNSSPIYLGHRNGANKFKGLIDDLLIYDVALTRAEINNALASRMLQDSSFSAALKNLNSGKCMDALYSATHDGSTIGQYTCRGLSNQLIHFHPIQGKTNTYGLKFGYSGKCMEVTVPLTGGDVVQNTCNGGLRQQFTLESSGNGTHFINSAAGGNSRVTILNGSTENEAKAIHLWKHGRDHQKWIVNNVPRPQWYRGDGDDRYSLTKDQAIAKCAANDSRLCNKSELEGHSQCSAGHLQDGTGYWMDAADPRLGGSCGVHGYNNWGGLAGAYCCPPIVDLQLDLQLHLKLDEAAGATTFSDSSGDLRNGTCEANACPTAGQVGQVRYAAVFDGDYLTVPHVLNPSTTAFTAAAKFKFEQVEGKRRYYILTQDHGTGTGKIWLMVKDGVLRTTLGGFSGTTVLSPNIWYHAAVTYDGTNVKLYLNGSQEGAMAYTPASSDGDMIVGTNQNKQNYYKGAIDEVRVYNRALWLSELGALATAGLGGSLISLRGAHGKYAVADSNGRMDADSDAIGSWGKFTLISNSDGTVSLRSHGDRYVSAQGGNFNLVDLLSGQSLVSQLCCDGPGTLWADSDAIGSWEKFTLISNSDGTFSFKSNLGRYLVAEDDGRMNADRRAIGSWEKFQLEFH